MAHGVSQKCNNMHCPMLFLTDGKWNLIPQNTSTHSVKLNLTKLNLPRHKIFIEVTVNRIKSSSNKTLGLIKRNLWNCPRNKKIAYTTIVRPKLEYASASWPLGTRTTRKTLQYSNESKLKGGSFCLQNYDRTASVSDMLKELESGIP